MTLRCLVIDDEPFALELMSDNISRVPFLQLAGAHTDPFAAMSLLDGGQIDLLFLDIQMPTLTGIQFLRTLAQPPMVILTTAYEQYALEGFDLNVVDYLLKPIPFERFLRGVNKARELHRLKNPPDQTPDPLPIPSESTFIVVFSEYSQIRIAFEHILYVEALKDYVKVFVEGRQRPILTRQNLKQFESRLPIHQFCRVHRSYIVALDKVSSFQKSRVMVGGKSIPVSERFAGVFNERYVPR